MSLMDKRIDNVMKAMRESKDYGCKVIWNNKLQQLFEIRRVKAYERLEDKARMVHWRSAGVGNFSYGGRINDCKYRNHG